MAPGLLVDPVRRIALPVQFNPHCPGLRPHRRILDRNLVIERLRVGAREALDDMQVLVGSSVVALGAEIGDVDDQRITLPATARVPPLLSDV